MEALLNTQQIKEKLVLKTARSIRKFQAKEDDTTESMYRPGIKLDLERSRFFTESYKETEGEPMVIRRAKAIEKFLTRYDPGHVYSLLEDEYNINPTLRFNTVQLIEILKGKGLPVETEYDRWRSVMSIM